MMDPTDKPSDQTPPTQSPKILLVEDDNNLADVYSTRLSAEGFNVTRVADGEQALAAVIKDRPDLVLLDIMMPKISGFDVLDILRNTPEIAQTKIIMLSARGQESDKRRAEGLGANDYLVKSQIVMTDIISHIKEQLGIQ